MGILEDKLKDCRLTKTNRRIGEFCLQNKQALPLLSSVEIARQVGVSDVSVIRFSKLLGYSSFADFKHDIQRDVANLPSDYPASPIVHFVSNRSVSQDGQREDPAQYYQQIVQDIFEKNERGVFDRAAQLILASRNRYVLGIRFRNSVAEICANLLRMSTTNVIHIPPSDYAAFQYAMDFTREDCLIWFSFGRFTNFEKQILRFVRQSGIRLIVISDERASQSALAADLLIQSSGRTPMPFYSSAGNCIIAELIASSVSSVGWLGAEKRLQDFESSLQSSVIPSEKE